MKALAFNGSPRKNWNTATLLNKALEGAASQGAETEIIHLYDYTYKGCASCFQCKRDGGRSYGQCGLKDELTPVLEKVKNADVLLIGSPIYLGSINGETHSFFERLIFPYYVYDKERPTLFPKTISTAFIYTMGVDEERMKLMDYGQIFGINQMFLERVFGKSEFITANDMTQFDDYAKYVAPMFDVSAKAHRRETVFPRDCERAFELGARLAQS